MSEQQAMQAIKDDIAEIKKLAEHRDLQIQDIKFGIQRVEALLKGEFGSLGLVTRVENAEKAINNFGSKIVWISGFAAGASIFIGKVLTKIGV